jgi:hypothetical protein
MEARDHNHFIVDESIEQRVWEPNKHGTTSVPMHDSVELWHFSYRIQRAVNFGEEFLSQAGPLSLVPEVCFIDLCGRSGPDYERAQRGRLRMR